MSKLHAVTHVLAVSIAVSVPKLIVMASLLMLKTIAHKSIVTILVRHKQALAAI
ncbi:hypothetical protein [Legionella jamestowniensis]|uniref:Uncharacterized protein n=1 Tax=Legionella jamestowniensis TaxID=455 RepID=A0A0W0UKI6_9GAMM|nr:hypothetical protein [Legionella jamestowniensis]KTD08041.1 hypothetical protein Ljam_2236 [Legionella jamestowniensis]SFM06173.1 hypothetical protein SAMN02746073_0196 [Legionella jamestowniensis DSM 19215]